MRKKTKPGPVAERLAILLDVFSPWEDIPLTYRQFAADLGAPVTPAAVKKWPQRRTFPTDAARLIVMKARERGVAGVTPGWVLWGDGEGPRKARGQTQVGPGTAPSRPSPASLESHGRLAAAISEALQADLRHNEFGQWSSVEMQRTVIWALKDLARRLRALRFDMGKTFDLADSWAGKIGLPVRPPGASPDEGHETTP